ncbi:MAG: CHC2 zinc finger domain-containing protein, partial [Porphyromonadaceae bacterium]|nr:CHC2 zinc finger domain-containing protein [Porphyromonadaceae bacterium]
MYTNKSVVIDPITKQKIFDSAQILDIVSDFVSLKKRGSSYVGLCPFHADRNPSFYVTPSKNICKCFACGE